MKQLYIIGGPMGIGKTTACRALQSSLDRCVFFDGDWAWDMHPFVVSAETKSVVQGNIRDVLNRFLHCDAFDHVIFCWVLHQQATLNALLSSLDLSGCQVLNVSLVCAPSKLAERVRRDVSKGLRGPDAEARSLAYLPCFAALDTLKLDVTELTPEETARMLRQAADVHKKESTE